MTTKLRAVEKQPDFAQRPAWLPGDAPETEPADDFNNDITGADAAADAFADAVSGALQSSIDEDGEIKPARAWAEEQLSHAIKREEELQTKLAAANAAYDRTVAQAIKDRDAVIEDVTAKLRRTTGFRAALAIFKGELVKAEL